MRKIFKYFKTLKLINENDMVVSVLSCTPSAPPVGGGGTGSKNFPVLPSLSKIKILY